MITSVKSSAANYLQELQSAWNTFWFRAEDPFLLGLLRLLVGSMVFYTHLVWTLEFSTFLGTGGVLTADYGQMLSGSGGSFWSHFYWIQSPTLLLITHIFALVVFACFALGLFARTAAILSFLFLVSYAHRATGALFGLDQINGFLTFYLALGPCGAALSLDRWLRRKKHPTSIASVEPSVGANLSLRLIQVHMCVVYLFAGLGKLQGPSWWNGEALWGALASYDYQTLDLTWMAGYMWLINLMTFTSIVWEVSYAFLVWPKLTRPICLLMAFIVHAGIGLGMGMLTFGLIMIFGNLAFLPSAKTRQVFESVSKRRTQSS